MTTPEYATPQPAPLEPPTTEPQPPKTRPTTLIIAAAVGALVVLAVAGIVTFFALSDPDPNDPMSFVPQCREAVKAKMKAPATTQFPGGETVDGSETQSAIVGAYDSQNGFGALVRGSYRCLLFHDDAGKFRIAEVSVNE